MTTATTAVKSFRRLTRAKVDKKVRSIKTLKIGEATRQGDIYIHRVPDDFARGKLLKKGEVQLAIGTNAGSRHMATGAIQTYEGVELPPGVKAPQDADPKEMIGPVIVASGKWSVPHPEHAKHSFSGGKGTYAVTYQFDTKTMRRVAD